MMIVVAEILQVFHLAAWFTGLFVFIGGPILFAYWVVLCDSIGKDAEAQSQQGESSLYTLDPRAGDPNCVRSTSDILAECLTLRSRLEHNYRVLCERAGVSPTGCSSMVDLITEAVFDGRRINQCVYELELKEAQHA